MNTASHMGMMSSQPANRRRAKLKRTGRATTSPGPPSSSWDKSGGMSGMTVASSTSAMTSPLLFEPGSWGAGDASPSSRSIQALFAREITQSFASSSSPSSPSSPSSLLLSPSGAGRSPLVRSPTHHRRRQPKLGSRGWLPRCVDQRPSTAASVMSGSSCNGRGFSRDSDSDSDSDSDNDNGFDGYNISNNSNNSTTRSNTAAAKRTGRGEGWGFETAGPSNHLRKQRDLRRRRQQLDKIAKKQKKQKKRGRRRKRGGGDGRGGDHMNMESMMFSEDEEDEDREGWETTAYHPLLYGGTGEPMFSPRGKFHRKRRPNPRGVFSSKLRPATTVRRRRS